MNNYQSGTTIKITATFKDEDGVIFDPTTTPSLKLYNGNYSLISTHIPTKESSGVYYYFLQIPSTTLAREYIYEWSCIVDSNPTIKRERIRVDFV